MPTTLSPEPYTAPEVGRAWDRFHDMQAELSARDVDWVSDSDFDADLCVVRFMGADYSIREAADYLIADAANRLAGTGDSPWYVNPTAVTKACRWALLNDDREYDADSMMRDLGEKPWKYASWFLAATRDLPD